MVLQFVSFELLSLVSCYLMSLHAFHSVKNGECVYLCEHHIKPKLIEKGKKKKKTLLHRLQLACLAAASSSGRRLRQVT